MVAATYCPEPRNNPQILVSVDQLRGYFREAETELYRSKGFRKILADFRQRGALNSETQAMMKAICREAIRSTLRQMCCIVPALGADSLMNETHVGQLERSSNVSLEDAPQIANIATMPMPHAPASLEDASGSATTCLQNPLPHVVEGSDAQSASVLEIILESEETSVADAISSTPRLDSEVCEEESANATSSKLNPLHWFSRSPKPYAPTLEELRKTQLHEIGRTIQEARIAKAIPLEAIHQRTLIARHQIRDIEAGEGRWLPEDIYLKSFIRRMGDAVGLDGQALAEQLTPLTPTQPVRPSWYQHSPAIAASHGDPTQLYLRYAAVVAGSVWGLSWMSQHPLNLSQVPVFNAESGAAPIQAAPRMAEQGMTLEPTATVDPAGNIKIQFSNSPILSPKAPEKAAMERPASNSGEV